MNMHLQPYLSFVECRVNVDVCFYSTCHFLCAECHDFVVVAVDNNVQRRGLVILFQRNKLYSYYD